MKYCIFNTVLIINQIWKKFFFYLKTKTKLLFIIRYATRYRILLMFNIITLMRLQILPSYKFNYLFLGGAIIKKDYYILLLCNSAIDPKNMEQLI